MQNIKPILAGWLQSQADPSTVSNTVRGAILALSSIIILVATQIFHIQLSANDVISLATEVGALAGSTWFLYGLIFKGTVKMGTVGHTVE